MKTAQCGALGAGVSPIPGRASCLVCCSCVPLVGDFTTGPGTGLPALRHIAGPLRSHSPVRPVTLWKATHAGFLTEA